MGWALDISWLKNPFPDPAFVAPSTAILFILICSSMLLQKNPASWTTTASRLLAIISVFAATLVFGHYIGLSIDFDQLFFTQHLAPTDSGRMAVTTAFNFILSGLSLIFLSAKNERRRLEAQLSSLTIFCIALVTLTGYVYDRSSSLVHRSGVPMALPTGIMFSLFAIALLNLQKDYGLMPLLLSRTQGGKILRALLPVAITVPIITGWVRIIGQSLSLIDNVIGTSIISVTLAAVLGGMIFKCSKSVDEADSARIAAEAELKKEKNLLESVLNNMVEGILVLDSGGNFVKYNFAAINNFGFHPTNLTVEEWSEAFDCFLPDRVTPFPAETMPLARATRGENFLQVPMFLRNKKNPDGIFVSVSARPFQSDHKVIEGSIVVIQNINERWLAEELREKLAAVVECSQDAIISKNLDGTILTWNQGAERIFGYTSEESIGKNISILIPAFLSEEEPMVIEKLKSGEPVKHYETVRQTKDGQLIDVSLSISPIRNLQGEIIGASKILRDVTERKQADTSLQAAKAQLENNLEELSMLNQELATAKDQAQQASKLKSDFVANMSHEIRTPMNGIIGMTNVLLMEGLNEKQQEYAKTIKSAANSLLTIINDILDFSKIEAGKIELEMCDFDLVQVVEGACQIFASQARRKDLSLTNSIEPFMPRYVQGDPERLRQVLLNLISNAIKFTQSGEVAVNVAVESRQGSSVSVRFSVMDDGIGLTHDEQERLFQPFVQADGSISRKFGGSGLGLSISKRLVELMGGSIGIESVKNKGSTFWFVVPFEVRSEVLVLREPVNSKTAELAPTHQEHTLKYDTNLVLVAEDHPVNQQVARLYLDELRIPHHIVSNGREAINAFKENRYALILMDCQMPEVDGLTATGIIRNMEALKGKRTPIIAMTAHAMEGDRERCLAAGMDDYIGKPVDYSEFKNIMKQWIPKNNEKEPPIELSALLKKFDSKSARMLIDMFLCSTPETLEQLQKALDNENLETISDLAHYLKGSSSTLHATRFKKLCTELEKINKQKNISDACAIKKELEIALLELKEYVEVHFNMINSASNAISLQQADLFDVLIVEDDPILNKVMSIQLSVLDGIQLRQASNGKEALLQINEKTPSLLILDISLPDLNGFEIVEKLRQSQSFPNIPLIVYTSHDLSTAEQEQLRLGQTKFITKTMEIDELQNVVLDFMKSSERAR